MVSRRAALYARISKESEESVSIERQLEAGRQYAAARGWHVVGEYVDDGVSATRNRPEDRAGWCALLDSQEHYDAVVIWKIDRLARRVLDFHLADKALNERGAALVAVENSIDMSSPDGRLVANTLATFAEYEAEAISARVRASRTHLIRAGRVVGGTVPYGWRKVPNPTGPGYVLAQDPDRIEYVRGAVKRVRAGASVYSVVQWLDEQGAPLPGASQKNRKREGWTYSTVERILRHPVLAGMIPFNPGRSGTAESKQRGKEVLRGEDGLPVVNRSIAIMAVAEWRAMVHQLEIRGTAQTKPRALRSKTSPLLSGLVLCGHCETPDGECVRMHRGTTSGRPGYSCRMCHQTITNFEDYVVAEFLRQKGERVRWSLVEDVEEGGEAVLPEIEHRLQELSAELLATDDDDEADRLTKQIAQLRALRREERQKPTRVVARPVRHTQTYGEDWAEATTVEARREVLEDALRSVFVRRGRVGRGLDTSRFTFDWKIAEDLGPIVAPDDETLAAWAES